MKLKRSFYVSLLISVGLVVSCQKETIKDHYFKLPPGFNMPFIPQDNELTDERFLLGKKLFYDPVLSRDSTVSCASCHKIDLSFTDGIAVSLGIENRPGTRNASSLANVAYEPYLLREGGVPTLEMQVLVPVQEHAEFDYDMVLLAEKLRKDVNYNSLSKNAYGREMDPFVITRAIANFERHLISGESAYDKFQSGQAKALSPSAQKGRELFFSERLNCSQCHGGQFFTNHAFENNGLYPDYLDMGRKRLTGKAEDDALYKVPSLRNIGLTAPYMHDGSLPDLMTVINHYSSGGYDHPHKSNLIKPLNLSETEKSELFDFLNSLTDYNFVSNQNFKR